MKKTLYIYKSGILSRKDNSLTLEEKNGNITYIPIEQTNAILFFGNVVLNKRTLSLLKEYNVSVSFFSYYGKYIGDFIPDKIKDGKIIMNQVLSYNDERRLYIAKNIVSAETKNCIALIKYYNKKNNVFSYIIDDLDEYLSQIELTCSIEELLLLEAKIKKVYYSSFDWIIKSKDFIFRSRSFYPPKNEVNAVMSYGYAIIYAEILSEIHKSSLIPQISFIHSLSKHSNSLQYDLADIFKSVLIDRLMFRIINKGQLSKNCFDYKKEGSYLNKKGAHIFLKEYDTLMTNSVKIGNKYYSYRNLLTREVYNLSNYIEGKSKSYKPYVMRW